MRWFSNSIRDFLSYVPWIPRLFYYQSSDPCIDAGENKVIPFYVAINCYNSFPLTYSQQKATLDALVDASDLDVQGHNINDVLNKIKEKSHMTAHGFHKDLMITYNEMLDLNYKYTPQCFSTFEFVHPFPLEMVNNEFQIVKHFRHHPKLMKEWGDYEAKVQKYAGSEIIEVNGIIALKFLEEYSQSHIGSTPDPQARLALTLARAKFKHGKWVIEEGAFSRTRIAPEKPYLELTIIYMNEPIKIKAPYLAISPKNFDSRVSFYSQNCLSRCPSPSNYTTEFWIPKSQGLSWKNQMSTHLRNRTGILKIQKFKKENATLHTKEIVSGLKEIKEKNITSLILDLSDATGDGVCMTKLLLQILFNKRIDIWSHFRHSSALAKLIEHSRSNSLLDSDFVFNEKYITFLSFLKTEFRYYALSKFSYTPPLQEACPQDFNYIPGLIPDKIAVMTNGICFGACALFVYEVSSLPQVKTFKVGGMKKSPALLASSPDYKTNLAKVMRSNCLMGISKQFFPESFDSLVLYLPVREFIHKSGTTIRSRSLLAHHHIMHPTTSLPSAAWDQISSLML
ncbi:hypothetical protein DSO57_1023239 [Entomophthora muscae]|uniref:Uncharacterized protein n=1 Tax=Entomophthora muscae TaxID=34485 RepID=A0ACC2RHP4_9FUNG|nr:hypothetical protein DSO57_1023239 [Entomophthora muscae]